MISIACIDFAVRFAKIIICTQKLYSVTDEENQLPVLKPDFNQFRQELILICINQSRFLYSLQSSFTYEIYLSVRRKRAWFFFSLKFMAIKESKFFIASLEYVYRNDFYWVRAVILFPHLYAQWICYCTLNRYAVMNGGECAVHQ